MQGGTFFQLFNSSVFPNCCLLIRPKDHIRLKYVTNVLQRFLIFQKFSRKLASVNQKRRFSPNIKLVFKRLIIFWSLVRAQHHRHSEFSLRSKTQGRRQDEAFISIKIVDEAKILLEKYIGKLNLRYGAYDYLDYALYKGMKGLRELTGIPELTLYWARHTFGTLARNVCRMSVDDIGEALNHVDNGHVTTDIYIAKDWTIVDDVQFQVIGLIKNGQSLENKAIINTPEVVRRSMKLISA